MSMPWRWSWSLVVVLGVLAGGARAAGAAIADTAFAVDPTLLDFGEFRFDTAQERSFQISNPGDVDVEILSAPLTLDPGTAPDELIAVIRRGGGVVELPQTLAPGELLDVTVTADPANRSGPIGGHIDVHSGIPGRPDQRVALTGTAIAAAVSTPALVDFGAVDIAAAAPSQTVEITNSGSAPLGIPLVSVLAGSSPAFAVTLPAGPVTVAPGQTLAIPVSYQPTTVRPAASFDALFLVADVTGTVGGPDQVIVSVRGRGIGRALVVTAAPVFPVTLPNPGDTAPQRAVTIRNSGEATLHITQVALTGAPVWQLVSSMDAGGVELAGGASHDFDIRFAPTMVGLTSAVLTLVSDDPAQPTTAVTLTGNSASREVAFVESSIDVGEVAIGSVGSAELTIRNLDTANAVNLRDAVVDDPQFMVAGVAGARLDAGEARAYRVRFAPLVVGELHAAAALYLDGDTAPRAMIALTGRGTLATRRDAADGGSCGAGRGAGGGALLLLLLLLALLGARRAATRRRRVAP